MILQVEEENSEKSIIYYEEDVISKAKQTEIYDWLESMQNFRQGQIGELPVSRFQKWYHTDKKYFSKDWKVEYDRWKSFDYCDKLYEYQCIIQKKTNTICSKYNLAYPKINSCLINLYRNGDDIIKRHSDNQTSFGETPTIVILSLGQPRTIHFTRKIYNPVKQRSKINDNKNEHLNTSILLKSGSILIMAGATQKYYFHGIEKEHVLKKRYSMTWREYI